MAWTFLLSLPIILGLGNLNSLGFCFLGCRVFSCFGVGERANGGQLEILRSAGGLVSRHDTNKSWHATEASIFYNLGSNDSY